MQCVFHLYFSFISTSAVWADQIMNFLTLTNIMLELFFESYHKYSRFVFILYPRPSSWKLFWQKHFLKVDLTTFDSAPTQNESAVSNWRSWELAKKLFFALIYHRFSLYNHTLDNFHCVFPEPWRTRILALWLKPLWLDVFTAQDASGIFLDELIHKNLVELYSCVFIARWLPCGFCFNLMEPPFYFVKGLVQNLNVPHFLWIRIEKFKALKCSSICHKDMLESALLKFFDRNFVNMVSHNFLFKSGVEISS